MSKRNYRIVWKNFLIIIIDIHIFFALYIFKIYYIKKYLKTGNQKQRDLKMLDA